MRQNFEGGLLVSVKIERYLAVILNKVDNSEHSKSLEAGVEMNV